MNLYAITPAYAPYNEVDFFLAENDTEAMENGVFVAAKDVVDVNYCSPYAQVFLVATDLKHIGDARATDAPWPWAHPAVEENVAREACLEAELDFEAGSTS
jgi:hypothetical protein